MSSDQVLVLVPVAASGIDAGSGIVTTRERWEQAHGSDLVTVWFEGNRVGAVNLARWADRVHCAADRMAHAYPTSAMRAMPAAALIVLAGYDPSDGALAWYDTDWDGVLAGWLGRAVVEEDLLTTVAAHEAGRAMAVLRAGTPDQQAAAATLSAYGPALYRGR